MRLRLAVLVVLLRYGGEVGICPACGRSFGAPLCSECLDGLRPAAARHLASPDGSSLLVRAAFLHSDTARVLVHRLKYHANVRAAAVLARAMMHHVPPAATALVPLPRAVTRRLAFGVDAAVELAAALSANLGVPLVRALGAPLWWSSHAGADRTHRAPVGFRLRRPVPPGAVLIDDVLTTGATLLGARAAVGDVPVVGVVATLAGTLSSMEAAAPHTGRDHVVGTGQRAGGGFPTVPAVVARAVDRSARPRTMRRR